MVLGSRQFEADNGEEQRCALDRFIRTQTTRAASRDNP